MAKAADDYADELGRIIDSYEGKVASLMLNALLAEYGIQAAAKFSVKNAVKSLAKLMGKPKFTNGIDDTITSAVIASLDLANINVKEKILLARQVAEDAIEHAAQYYEPGDEETDANDQRSFIEQTAKRAARWMLRNAIFEAQTKAKAGTKKTWITRNDNRVRHSHAAMHGQTVSSNASFQLPNGGVIRYPGDPRAPLSESVNCRCVMVFK